ncbi:ribonuclease III [Candidatus Bipolaricaulota bacterium]|nr:ribonuclease III [Candidatus Bipolaricaulota bacterium]
MWRFESSRPSYMESRDLSRLVSDLGLDLPPEELTPAFYHASYANEKGLESNERLEFLGDAVLDLTVAEILFRRFPERDEGELTKLRSVLVSRPTLAEIARELGLERYLLLSPGAEELGVRERPSVLAAALEAVVGVIFLHKGYEFTRGLVERLYGKRIAEAASRRPEDYKSLLQELGQRRFGELPRYRLLEAEGPEHEKVFTVEASLGGESAIGRGRNLKEAEQAAAKRLYLALEGISD